MSRYYCPYCLPSYKFHKTSSDEAMICAKCGEPLVKIPLLKITQIFALVSAIAFITPFVFMIFSSLRDLNREKTNIRNKPIEIISQQVDE